MPIIIIKSDDIIKSDEKNCPSEEQKEKFALRVTEELVKIFKVDKEKVKIHFKFDEYQGPFNVQIMLADRGQDTNKMAIAAIVKAAKEMHDSPTYDFDILTKENTWFGGKRKS